MSVRKGDRGEGKLQVLNKARELKNYSLGLIKNEKHFPKSTRWLYAARGDTYYERQKMISFYKNLEVKANEKRLLQENFESGGNG